MFHWHPITRKNPGPPRHIKSPPIQKLNRRNERVDRLRRQLPLLQQMQFILPDGLQIQMLWAGMVELCEFRHIVEITSLGGGCEATQLHVLDEAFTKRCHAMAPEIVGLVVG